MNSPSYLSFSLAIHYNEGMMTASEENMSTNTLIKGTLLLSLPALITRVMVVGQRILEDEGMATYGIAYYIYGILLILATIGIPSALSKQIADIMPWANTKKPYTAIAQHGTSPSLLVWYQQEFRTSLPLGMPSISAMTRMQRWLLTPSLRPYSCFL